MPTLLSTLYTTKYHHQYRHAVVVWTVIMSLVGLCIMTVQHIPSLDHISQVFNAATSPITTEAAELSGYQLRYRQTTRGGMVFAGNALGLNTYQTISGHPLNGSIDAYMSLDTTLQVAGFPAGTTTNWRNNGSYAVVDIPTGASVLYAELIWGANYKNLAGSLDITSNINTPVAFTTPTASSSVAISSDGQTASETEYGYIRTADVTQYVQTGGTYSVAGVPGIIDPQDESSNYAGWTLAVAYAHPDLPIRNLSIYTGSESVYTNQQNGNVVAVTGFGTPVEGSFEGKLWISAQEGDSNLGGDQLLFGRTPNDLEAISGPNNPSNNFFAAQINTSNGTIDTRGSFGTANQPLGSSQGGKRHGFDITAVNVTDKMVNGQTEAFIKGNSSSDIYVLNALGVQIDVNAPSPTIILTRDRDKVQVGDTITYSIVIANTGSISAQQPTLATLLPEGTEFITDSLIINNVPSNLNPTQNAISIADITTNESQSYQFSVRVMSEPANGIFENQATINYNYTPIAGGTVINETTHSQYVRTTLRQPPQASDDTATTVQKTPITIPILSNDSADIGSDLDATTTTIITSPTNGNALFDPETRVLLYTPQDEFYGVDTLEYRVCDTQQLCDTAQVSITVERYLPPQANQDTASTLRNQPVSIPILTNDNNPLNDLNNGLALPQDFDSIIQQPSQGTAIYNSATGMIDYIPETDYGGNDIIEYRICNADGCSQTLVSINIIIPDKPDASDDVATITNTVQTAFPVTISPLVNDTAGVDRVLDATTLAITQQPEHGVALLNTDEQTITYTSNLPFNGTDSISYTICNDADECDTATILITVVTPNPPLAVEPSAPQTTTTTQSPSNTSNPQSYPVNVTQTTAQPQPQSQRTGQILGVNEVLAPLPRTGGQDSYITTLVLFTGVLIAAGFFGSLYSGTPTHSHKTKTY